MNNPLPESLPSEQIFTCPNCLEGLQQNPGQLVCSKCGSTFRSQHGIPVFRSDQDTYYGEFPREQVLTFLKDFEQIGDNALAVFLRQQDAPQRLGEYIMGSGRAGWKFLLPPTEHQTVLDLGCGWGALAYSFTSFASRVLAMDSTIERMQFLQKRASRDGIRNLTFVCAGDAQHLPLPDGTVDVVILNGVLEWVPSGLPGNPRQVQINFLKEVRRVLSPDGVLFLGIENRAAWKTWFWQRDGHTNLRFVPWLPRVLANLYSRLKGQGEYRNYLYNRSGYRKLLRMAGFPQSRFYVPVPGYHHPTSMVPAEDHKQIQKKIQRPVRAFTGRLKQTLKGWLASYFPDAFGIVASGRSFTSFVDDLLAQESSQVPSLQDCSLMSYRINGEMGMTTLVLAQNANEGGAIVKLPLHQRAEQELRLEREGLQAIHEGDHALSPLKGLVPRSLATGVFKSQPYYVYQKMPGVSGDQLAAESSLVKAALQEMTNFGLNALVLTRSALAPTQDDIRQHVTALTNSVRSLVSTPTQERRLSELDQSLTEQLIKLNTGFVMAHGDFKLANGLFEAETGRLQAVIDWGAGFGKALPLYDLSFLLADFMHQHMGTPLPNLLKGLIHRHDCPAWFTTKMETMARDAGEHYDLDVARVIGQYQWLRRMAPLGAGYEARRFDFRMLDAQFAILEPR